MPVRLAQRLQRIKPSATVSITARALALRDQGRDIISLSAGEPDFDTPQHVKDAAIAAIRAGETKYTAIDGTRLLKHAIIRKLDRENGLSYQSEQILVTSGAKQACFNACQALLDPGDEVIIPAPHWVSYPDMARLADADPVIVHTDASSSFRMTPEQLEAAITPQTRLVILNSPCNPTGTVYGEADWQSYGEILRDNPRIWVLADDIYEHIQWADAPFSTIARACPHLLDRTVTVNGVSKCYAMSGWRVGYAAGPAEMIRAMTALQSQSTTNACSISQAAATAALDGDQSFVREICASFRQRHDVVYAELISMEGVECVPGLGTFYLFPGISEAIRIKGLANDMAFCEALLEDAGVALVPGSAFGAPGHLRISFAASTETLNEALNRLEQFISG